MSLIHFCQLTLVFFPLHMHSSPVCQEYIFGCLFTLRHLIIIYSPHFTSKSILYTMHLLCILKLHPKWENFQLSANENMWICTRIRSSHSSTGILFSSLINVTDQSKHDLPYNFRFFSYLLFGIFLFSAMIRMLLALIFKLGF